MRRCIPLALAALVLAAAAQAFLSPGPPALVEEIGNMAGFVPRTSSGPAPEGVDAPDPGAVGAEKEPVVCEGPPQGPGEDAPRVASDRELLREGETVSSSQGGPLREVTLLGAADEDTVIIRVDGETREIDVGEQGRFSGLGIYVAKVLYLPKERQASFARLVFFRTGRITLADGREARAG